jgi:hypothetical protein
MVHHQLTGSMMNSRLYIYDCLTAKLRVSDRDFMTIGNAEGNTFRLTMRAANGGVFAQRNGFAQSLSIVDLLFNTGPEGLLVLRDSARIG